MQWTALALSGAYLSKKIVLLKVARTSGEKGSDFVKLEKMKVPNLKLSMKKMKQNYGFLHNVCVNMKNKTFKWKIIAGEEYISSSETGIKLILVKKQSIFSENFLRKKAAKEEIKLSTFESLVRQKFFVKKFSRKG